MFEFRLMSEGDLEGVLQLERACFQDPWEQESFESEIAGAPRTRWPLVAVRDDALAGYVIAWFIEGQAHVANLAVAPEWRRQGLGFQLMRAAIVEALRRGARWIGLEVRASNRPAVSLYRKMGFRPAGLRKGYYSDVREDALVMTLVLAQEADPVGG